MTPVISWASDCTLRIKFADVDSDEAHALVVAVHNAIAASPPQGMTDVVSAYASTLVVLKGPSVDRAATEVVVRAAIARARTIPVTPGLLVELPCCYEAPFALDLRSVAEHHGVTPDDVIAAHAAVTYTVRFLGFSPGFPYLSGLPPRLHTPRLPTPRMSVPAGSVAIAGEQAGVYPLSTPGGWRILGRTPLPLFDPARAQPELLAMGMRVRFRAIPLREFDLIAATNRGVA